ncbi:MAG: riboflavin biosynthesis protein RibF [Deltaproteobacteria bacterium]|nr:riboflavin biosynthesis protein RibF [Deltaproteobacteria bacterium]
MDVIRGLKAVPALSAGTALTFGNFDGVHLGHREILRRVTTAAQESGTVSCVLTFHPHPLAVLAPERAPPLIQSLEDRLADLSDAAPIDVAVVVPFTRDLAAITAEAFVEDVLVGRLRCAELFVGGDARFGRDRAGDVTLLRARADAGAFRLHLVAAFETGGVRASSSGIRRSIAEGDVAGAARMLGRPFSIAGPVVTGAGRGRGIGYPTANLAQEGELRPGHGIYACEATAAGATWPAAVHVGPIPTFGAERPVVEAHLVGFSGDLVGSRIRLRFLERLRGVERFADAAALREQIAEDVRRTLEVVGR